LDARKARVVEMRFFGGMSVEEIGQALDVGPATVKRDWAMARAWLVRELRAEETDDAGPVERA
jgi:RNA polymerase sigma-70 factor, ECF subfamily